MYNDPSGEFLGLALWAGAAIIGALIGVASYAIGSYIANGSWEHVNLSGTLKAAFWGAVSGAVTFGIGDCFTTAEGAATAFSKTFGGVLVKAAAHGIAQGTLAMMQNDGAGFLSGAAGGFFGSLGATAWGGAGGKWGGIAGKYAGSDVGTIAFGALSGGVGAELSGGNFWQGAIAGGIVSGLNHVMHEMSKPKTIVAGIYGAGGESASGNPDLKKEVKRQGGTMFTSSVGGGDDEILEYLIGGYYSGKQIKIYGHSRGGAAAVRIANKLGAMHITISEMNLYDPVGLYGGGDFMLKFPNVTRLNNYYQRNPVDGVLLWADNPFIGSPVGANYNWGEYYPNINNVNLTGHYYSTGVLINHINITDYAIKHP